MGDTKKTRERKGRGKATQRIEAEIERELTSGEEPPAPQADLETDDD